MVMRWGLYKGCGLKCRSIVFSGGNLDTYMYGTLSMAISVLLYNDCHTNSISCD